MPGRPKVGVVVGRTGPGEESEDFAGNDSFEQSQDLFLGTASGFSSSPRDELAARGDELLELGGRERDETAAWSAQPGDVGTSRFLEVSSRLATSPTPDSLTHMRCEEFRYGYEESLVGQSCRVRR